MFIVNTSDTFCPNSYLMLIYIEVSPTSVFPFLVWRGRHEINQSKDSTDPRLGVCIMTDLSLSLSLSPGQTWPWLAHVTWVNIQPGGVSLSPSLSHFGICFAPNITVYISNTRRGCVRADPPSHVSSKNRWWQERGQREREREREGEGEGWVSFGWLYYIALRCVILDGLTCCVCLCVAFHWGWFWMKGDETWLSVCEYVWTCIPLYLESDGKF